MLGKRALYHVYSPTDLLPSTAIFLFGLCEGGLAAEEPVIPEDEEEAMIGYGVRCAEGSWVGERTGERDGQVGR